MNKHIELPALARDALTELIAQHLSLTYHCTRVWDAWNVGTMSQDDFEPVDESETPTEIADAILAAIAAQQRVLAEQARVVGEPVATIRYERGTPGKENDMPKVVSCNWLPDGVYSVYATPHTEAVRMSEAEILALWSGSEVATRPVLGSKKVIAFARAVEQATAARLGVKL